MKLIELTLNNFAIFKGKKTVRFPTDPAQNLMFVFRSNARGKSTLIDAIRWAIYGKRKNSEEELNVAYIGNLDASNNGDGRAGVTLIFENGDDTYQLSREVTPHGDNDFSVEVKLSKNNTAFLPNQIHDELDHLLPMQKPSLLLLGDSQLLYGDFPYIEPDNTRYGAGGRLMATMRNIFTNHDGPIVIESPFGILDNQYRLELLVSFENIANQTILLVNDTDIDKSEYLERLGKKTGAIYEIKPLSSNSSQLELSSNYIK
jgi:hypothetical protein